MKKVILPLTLAMLLKTSLGFAAVAFPDHSTIRFLLNNQMGQAAHQARLGSKLTLGTTHMVRGVYNYANTSGTTANLRGIDDKDVVIPAGAIITNVILDITTAITQANSHLNIASLSFGAASATDLKAATIITSLSGVLPGIPQYNTVTSYVRIYSDATVTGTVTGAALTAGKINVYIYYILPHNEDELSAEE